jgi:hypothetical protein
MLAAGTASRIVSSSVALQAITSSFGAGGGGQVLACGVEFVKKSASEHREAVGDDANRVESMRERADVVGPGGEGLAPLGAGVVVLALEVGCVHREDLLLELEQVAHAARADWNRPAAPQVGSDERGIVAGWLARRRSVLDPNTDTSR